VKMLARMCALAMLVLQPLGAQGAAPGNGESLRISVLTFGQGNAVFERFGHNALRVRDLATGEDLSYNWGLFSFDEPQFLRRFLSGNTNYWVDAFPTADMLDHYAQNDRHSVEQDLNLTPAQRAELAAFVRTNVLPDNKFYRYDYFLDNCSTRLRDALDRALGGALRTGATAVRTDLTFRSESVRLTAPSPFAQAGIDLALGPRADAPLTAWESMFIPMRLRDYLRTMTVPGPDGTTVPFVAEERVLYAARRPAELPERRGLAIGALGPVLGAWMLLLAPVGAAARRRTRIPAAVMATLWHTVTGLFGLLLLGMWVGSAHVFWYNNLNLLIASPLALVAAVPVTRAILRGAPTKLSDAATLTLLGMALLGTLLALFVTQRMASVILLLVPAQIGLAVAYWRHTRVGVAAASAP
jgi:hypothetical protein